MPGTDPIAPLDDVGQKILKAASGRFLHYGYGKTTMSEIAADCGMSTGNLYRYFPSKLDLAEAFVRELRTDHLKTLRAAAEPDGDPADQLRRFLQAKFKLAYDRFHDKPRAFELSSVILLERPRFAVAWQRAEAEILASILARGVKSGVFVAGDPLELAYTVQAAVFKFTTPAIFYEGDYGALSTELDRVIDLMLRGFCAEYPPKNTPN